MLQTLKDKEWVSSWYQERVRKFGLDPRSLGYNQRSSQLKRFEALAELGDFNGRQVLDVGCGLGDFLSYLLDQNIMPYYTGLDLVPEMIKTCKERFQNGLGPLCRFESGDTLEYVPSEKFDYVVASGVFGLRTESARERIVPTLRLLFSWCKIGLAINYLSNRASRHDPKCLYLDPAYLLTQALELTPAVRLSHNYLPNDFTLFLYKTPLWELDKNQASNGDGCVSIGPSNWPSRDPSGD